MLRLKIFLLYTLFWIFFALCFSVMFVFLVAGIMGVTAGVMLAVLGTAIIMFKASFIISALAPEIMLFGGLCGAFFAAFLGMTAIKIGFCVSRMFVRIGRRCNRMREKYYNAELLEIGEEQIEEEQADDE